MDFKLDNSIGFILSRTNTKFKNELSQRIKEYDVTPEQWALLNRLWEEDGITPKELSECIFKDKPNTNRILEKLQNKGLVIRKPHPIDKRAYQIFLTDSGWELKEKLIPKVVQLLEEVTRGIEKNKIEEVKILLNLMYNNLK